MVISLFLAMLIIYSMILEGNFISYRDSVIRSSQFSNLQYENIQANNSFLTIKSQPSNASHNVDNIETKDFNEDEDEKQHLYWKPFIFEPSFNLNSSCDLSCPIRDSFKWTMVVFIKSKANNYLHRMFIRRSWGSIRYTKSGRFLFVFVLGRAVSATLELVKEESMRYNDILMFDGPDDYRNVGSKTLAGMQWAKKKLPLNYLYSTGDDDFLIDMASLEMVVNKNIITATNMKFPMFPIICIYKVLAKGWVFRTTSSKYFVSYDDYQWPYYPKACLGGFYTSNVDTIVKMWNFIKQEPRIPMDDVWLTAVVRQKMGIPDYALIDTGETTAIHYEGFNNKGSLQSKTFMSDEWNDVYNKLSNLPHCRCR